MTPDITTFEILENGAIRFKDFNFTLQSEDFMILSEIVGPALDDTTGRKHTIAEWLFACLTYGLHTAYEDATGKKFTLRMDRKPNKA